MSSLADESAHATRVWNDNAWLHCEQCSARLPLGPHWDGCVRCGENRPLTVAYGEFPLTGAAEALTSDLAILHRELLPVAKEHVIELGQGRTPLLPARSLGERVWLKMEGQNPSGSHKDRFHAIALGLAQALGYRSTVTTSTGNHGAACAAYAAASGLSCLVVLHPECPSAIRTQIHVYGAHAATVGGDVRDLIRELVTDGWYPATSADPTLSGQGNPFGQEGYKEIAFEIVEQLGWPPAVIAIPVASGDTLYGVWRGFRDLHERLDLPMPTFLGCQPEGAAPLALTAGAASLDGPAVLRPESLALSTREARSGWHASVALGTDGMVCTVSETEIVDALRQFGREGLCVEPASVLGAAAIDRLRRGGEIDSLGPAVALVTSSGLNWTDSLDAALGPFPILTSTDEFRGLAHQSTRPADPA